MAPNEPWDVTSTRRNTDVSVVVFGVQKLKFCDFNCKII
jgi:hypothetical protein